MVLWLMVDLNILRGSVGVSIFLFKNSKEAQGIIPYALQVTVASPYPTLAQIGSMAS